jgi:hypothetical protein
MTEANRACRANRDIMDLFQGIPLAGASTNATSQPLLAALQPYSREVIRRLMISPYHTIRQTSLNTTPSNREYHVSSSPTSYLIDSSGKIVSRGLGMVRELETELVAALAKIGIAAIAR